MTSLVTIIQAFLATLVWSAGGGLDSRHQPCGLGVLLYPLFCSFSHLYPRLIQLGEPGQFFPVVDVWVLVLSKGHLQLFQLFVGEGGAVASPGGGGVRPFLPARAGHRRGLTWGPLPQRVSYVCFQQEENLCEALHGCFCCAGCSSCFLIFLIQRNPKCLEIVKENFTIDCVEKEGLEQLYGSHCYQATWEPQRFSCWRLTREKTIPETVGFHQDYSHNPKQNH